MNSEERSKQNGFGNRAAALDELDSLLYGLKHDDETYAKFVSDQSEVIRDWIVGGTENTDFYARNKYHLGVGVWLLTQPQTRVLSEDAWGPAVDEFLASIGLGEDRKD